MLKDSYPYPSLICFDAQVPHKVIALLIEI